MRSLMISILVVSIVSFSSCNSQTKEKRTESIKKNEDKLYAEYTPLMRDLLKNNNYKFLEHSVFKNKVIEYFGVDIDNAKFNDVYLESGLGYTALSNEGFIDTYQVDRGVIDGAGDAFADILKDGSNNDYNIDFINYNKVLFNDDLSAISKVNIDKDKVEDIVVYLNYEKNNLLSNSFVKNIKKVDNYNESFKWHLLWYNNKTKPDVIRKKILQDIANKKPDFIFDLAYFLNNNSNKIKEKTDGALIDATLAFLIEVELQHYEDKDLDDNKGYSLLNNFYIQNPKMLDRFKSQKFYGYPLIDSYTKKYLLMSEENEISYGKVIDPDGYTNLRKDKNSTSVIIEKIKSGEKVEILDDSENWWLIKTNSGNKGYVYKTKLQSIN
ncbi:SH3 domain-containing protein [Flavobacterium sp. KACC 22763]|uniref:SH3 domain-containing protein n=1 Tax=Flavobacterium sp. KACC 22763 TaxID=3025668 RepID=UPI0023657C49|nr:SH3 domain-containing protein [Flavobacterium sp. KACC 22763]WDF64938.1 SH3 domain-containing protein [Flavobacterium sp. KACC 22763]